MRKTIYKITAASDNSFWMGNIACTFEKGNEFDDMAVCRASPATLGMLNTLQGHFKKLIWQPYLAFRFVLPSGWIDIGYKTKIFIIVSIQAMWFFLRTEIRSSGCEVGKFLLSYGHHHEDVRGDKDTSWDCLPDRGIWGNESEVVVWAYYKSAHLYPSKH